MIELYMVTCLIQGSECKAVHLTYSDERITPMQLMSTAQQEIAKWMGEHPGWRIARYGTRRAGQEANL
jgi:hypothetical protein